MTFVLTQSSTPDRARFGGKACALAELKRANLPIPPWIALSPEAFFACLSDEERLRWDAAKDPADIVDVVSRMALTPEVTGMIESALTILSSPGVRLAVRSSAVDEDGATHSFAGQLDSFLYVRPSEVRKKIVDVWRSGFSDRLLAYRREHGLSLRPSPPAVLIQRMVNSEVSGVAFSADPVSGDRGVAVVAAVYGVGTQLVSGEADGDTYSVDRDGVIIRRQLAWKSTAHRHDETRPEGVASQPVDPVLADQPALSDSQIVLIAGLARSAAKYFGIPQDIEWAIESGKLFLLQSRPITSLAGIADPSGALALWDNSNIAESYGGVTTPLTFSFARRVYEEVYRQFLRILRVPEPAIAANKDTLSRMLGFLRGRIYYNLGSWYRVLALLPGFATNRQFMEQMMGVKEEMPAGLLDISAAAVPPASKFEDYANVARMVSGLAIAHIRLGSTITAFQARLNDVLADISEGETTSAPASPTAAEASGIRHPAVSLRDMRPDELVGYYRTLEQKLLTSWDAPLVNDFFAMIYFGLLTRLVTGWCKDPNGTLQNDLLCGQGGIISAEPARRVRTMARSVTGKPHMIQMLCYGSREQIEEAMISEPQLRGLYEAYLKKFGDRCLNELKLESPTLYDDPMLLLRSIGQYAKSPSVAVPEPESQIGTLAEQHAYRQIGPNPIRRVVFGMVLSRARARLRDRENLRFERTRLFGRVRRIFVELGKRLAASHIIEQPRDIFYLEIDEVLGFVEGSATTTNLTALIGLRKTEFDGFASADPPADRFETRGMVYQGNTFRAKAVTPVALDGVAEMKGLGCCPGVVRGPVRIVHDPRSAAIQPGEILVAERTDPGWIMLFAGASGLLVERGSLLSHSAIVSREMAIPGIVGLTGITALLSDGDWVEMDGSTGIIRRLPWEAIHGK